MGELIFVLVIVIQGIAGVAAAINKKKREREAALTKSGAPAKKSALGNSTETAKAAEPGQSANAFTARLEKARAARVAKASKSPIASVSDAPGSSTPDPTAQPAASAAPKDSREQRVARRREQIAQLRQMAQGMAKGIASGELTSDIMSKTSASAPTDSTNAPPAPARRTSPAPVPPQAAGRRVPQPPPRAAPPSSGSTDRARQASGRTKEATSAAASTASDFTPMKGARGRKKAGSARRRKGLHRMLATRSDLRRAIILKELLDPPVALRQDSEQGS